MREPLVLTGTVGIANLPDLEPESWPEYFKQVPTRAVRVAGPFTVLVHGDEGGEVTCPDGYLCVDARGYPYPIHVDEFDLIYGANKRIDYASLPPTTLGEIAQSHGFGVISKEEATVAARKLLIAHGLLDGDTSA